MCQVYAGHEVPINNSCNLGNSSGKAPSFYICSQQSNIGEETHAPSRNDESASCCSHCALCCGYYRARRRVDPAARDLRVDRRRIRAALDRARQRSVQQIRFSGGFEIHAVRHGHPGAFVRQYGHRQSRHRADRSRLGRSKDRFHYRYSKSRGAFRLQQARYPSVCRFARQDSRRHPAGIDHRFRPLASYFNKQAWPPARTCK